MLLINNRKKIHSSTAGHSGARADQYALNRLLLLLLAAIFLAPVPLLPVPSSAKPYRGAELRSIDTYLYGRFEVRLRSAAGSGLLSSFFTFYDGSGLPDNWNEIDLEIMGRYTDEAQYNVISPGQIGHERRDTLQFNPHDGFHIYALEWTPEYIAWQVDGLEVYRQVASHIAGITRAQKVMMNIWPPVAVNWGGVFDPAILPVYAYYDWVRYYAYTPESAPRFTLQWTDNFDNWNTSRWQKGMHTFDGNNADFIPQNAVFQDGFVILCLTGPNAVGYAGGAVPENDLQSPYIHYAHSYPDKVRILFSEPLDPLTANNPGNFLVPGNTVTQADLQSDGQTVVLAVPGIDVAINYNLLAFGVGDLAGNLMPLSSRVISTPLPLPAGINTGGASLSGYLQDQVLLAQRDYGYSGGVAVNNGSLPIANTSEPEIFQSERRGLTEYQIRLDNGEYDVKLLFAETEYTSAGARIFDVYAEGQLLLDDFDIVAEAGVHSALEKFLPGVVVNDGVLDLYFKAQTGEPVLNGLRLDALTGLLPGSDPVIPQDLVLTAFPNPFNAQTTLRYNLEHPATVHIQLYSLLGQRLHWQNDGLRDAGEQQVVLNFDNLAGGIYFLHLLAGNTARVIKLVYLP